jgi:hypothetical protein
MFETVELPRQRSKLTSRDRGGVCLPDTVEATDWLGVMRDLVAVCAIPPTLIYERKSFTAYPIINRDEQTVVKSFAATLLITVPSSHMPSKQYFMGRLHYNGSVHHDRCHRRDDGISPSPRGTLPAQRMPYNQSRQHASPSARENLASPITSTSTMTAPHIPISNGSPNLTGDA